MSDNTQTPGSGGMQAFDQLPPRLRQALANHPQNLSSEFAWAKLCEGIPERVLLAQLERMRNRP